jgi:hypothetical protein
MTVIALSVPAGAHYLIFPPSSAKSPVENPAEFMVLIKDAQVSFGAVKQRNPAGWDELFPEMKAKAGSGRLTDESCKRSGLVMTASAVIDKKTVPYRYVMKPGKVWTVYTQNDAGASDWIIRSDHEQPYRYFTNENDEKAAVGDLAEKLKRKKILGINVKLMRERVLYQWAFHHADAFYALLPYMSDKDEPCCFKMKCAETLIGMPDLFRFKSSLPKIDEIIKAEKDPRLEKDSYRDTYIERLYELKKAINGIK